MAYDEDADNKRLFMTNGTVAGTTKVEVKYNANLLRPYELETDGDNLYMAADCFGEGAELFRYNGTDLECGMAEGVSGTSTTDPKNLYMNGGDLYFTADLSATGREVYTATTYTTSGIPTDVRKESAASISVFPNPSHTIIEVRADKQINQLVLLNGQGKEIATSNTTTLNLEAHPFGVYALKVIFEDKTSAFSKMVISE